MLLNSKSLSVTWPSHTCVTGPLTLTVTLPGKVTLVCLVESRHCDLPWASHACDCSMGHGVTAWRVTIVTRRQVTIVTL
jgi:hypothetical protein